MKLVVLGDPVDHSLSPVLHGTAFVELGIPGVYSARRVDAIGMADAADDMRSGVLDGANITMPHKGLAAKLADRRAPTAQRTAAANTWVRVDGDVVAHNTDIAGIHNAWQWRGLPVDCPVLVLGSGGAASAALVALEDQELYVSARRPDAAQELADRVGVRARNVEWGTGVEGAVVVNATPLGMFGESLLYGVLEAAAGLFEMAYGSGPTPATVVAEAARIPVADGPSMLLGQAIASFRLWTGRRAPARAMEEAMRTELEVREAMAT